jgi:hypothetical protein
LLRCKAIFILDSFVAKEYGVSSNREYHMTIATRVLSQTIPSSGYSPEEAKQNAQAIIDQLGGTRALLIMVSANHFTSSSDEGRGALSFRFKGSRKANHVKIILTPSDTYTLRFGRVGPKMGFKVVEVVNDVYCEDLRNVFRNVTGLEIRVPFVRGINA